LRNVFLGKCGFAFALFGGKTLPCTLILCYYTTAKAIFQTIFPQKKKFARGKCRNRAKKEHVLQAKS
jgi:hypothetical protein